MYGDESGEIMCGYWSLKCKMSYTINVKHFEWAISLWSPAPLLSN